MERTYICTRYAGMGGGPLSDLIADTKVIKGYKTWRNAHKYAVNKFGDGRLVHVIVVDGHGTAVDTFTTVTSRTQHR